MATKIFKSSITFKLLSRIGFGYFKRKNHCKVSCVKPELEHAYNNQVTLEFFASFTYLAMASFFGRQSVSLPGFHKFFLDQTLEEREHAQKLINYLNQRGNCVYIQSIPPPATQCWDSPLVAFKETLELEKLVTQKLFDLHKLSDEFDDVCSCTFLENEFLEKQVEEYDALCRHVTELERIGSSGLGIYLYDRHLLKAANKKE